MCGNVAVKNRVEKEKKLFFAIIQVHDKRSILSRCSSEHCYMALHHSVKIIDFNCFCYYKMFPHVCVCRKVMLSRKRLKPC